MSAIPLYIGCTAILISFTLSLLSCTPAPSQSAPTEAAVAATVHTEDERPMSPSMASSPSSTNTLPVPTATPTAVPTATPHPSPTSSPQPAACAESAGTIHRGTWDSAVAGSAHAYSLYLPPCYEAAGPGYPVIYLLAGNIHDEGKWLELGLDKAADKGIAEGALAPFIVVMPDGGWIANNTSGGPGSYESLMLDELIPHVESNYCVWRDAAGRAIGGLSRGGYWALEIALRSPERFDSVGGHSAALLDSYAGPEINPQYTALSRELGDLRIYLDIGSEDYVRANTVKLHEDMQAAGVAHDWHLNSGRHEDAYWAAHLSDYLQWYAYPWPQEREAYPPCKP